MNEEKIKSGSLISPYLCGMRKIYLLISLFVLVALDVKGQCTYNFPNNFNNQITFASIINCNNGTVILDNANDKNGNSTVTFTQNVTLNNLTINFKNGANPLEFIIPAGVTVTILNNLSFNVNSSPQEKFLTVNGNLIVGNIFDIGNVSLEIDGSGSIKAKTITGTSNTTCGEDADCPTIIAENCDGNATFCDSYVLPIELISFTAVSFNNSIQLNWITAKEENFSHFELERSLDQKSFELIGIIQGQGESFSDVHYKFEDSDAPFGKIYYRLNAVDIDDTFEYSPVISVENSFKEQLSVYPNPILENSEVKLKVPGKFTQNISYLALYNMQGSLVEEFIDFNPSNQLTINKVKSGMYMLKIQYNGLEENVRVYVK